MREFIGAVLYEAFREQYFEGAALLFQKTSLGGKVTPPASGFEGGVVKVPLGDVLLFHKILRQHFLRESYTIFQILN